MLIVIGTSPFHDTSVAVGPFRSEKKAGDAADELTSRGWNAETIPLSRITEIPELVNEEG
jgi:hypothetical protein